MHPHGRNRLNNNAQSLTLRLTIDSQMDVSPNGERLRPSLVVRVMGSLRLTNGLPPSGCTGTARRVTGAPFRRLAENHQS